VIEANKREETVAQATSSRLANQVQRIVFRYWIPDIRYMLSLTPEIFTMEAVY